VRIVKSEGVTPESETLDTAMRASVFKVPTKASTKTYIEIANAV